MGRSFTNVILSRGAADYPFVVAALDEHLDTKGWDRVQGVGTRLRTVVLQRREPVVALYDEGTDEQDADALEALGAGLSLHVGGVVFTTLCQDSEFLRIGLFEGGAGRGFVEKDGDDIRVDGDVFEVLARAFPQHDATRVRSAVTLLSARVEDCLPSFFAALGLPPEVARQGYASLPPGVVDSSVQETRRYQLRPPALPIDAAIAPVVMDPLESGSFGWNGTFRNHGARALGLTLRIEGDTRISAARLTVGGEPPREALVNGNTFMFGVEVPAGAPADYLAELKLLGFAAWSEVAMPTLLSLELEGTARSGPLHLRWFAEGCPVGTTRLDIP